MDIPAELCLEILMAADYLNGMHMIMNMVMVMVMGCGKADTLAV